MRSEFVSEAELAGVHSCLYDWRDMLALEVSLSTGLRIGDVLSMRPEQLVSRPRIREEKTGKVRRVYLSKRLLHDLKAISGAVWVFEGAKPGRHRSYDALYRDVRQAAVNYTGERSGAHISPHSWRKAYAVRKYNQLGDIAAVQRIMGHDEETVTMLYALSDKLSLSAIRRRAGEPPSGGGRAVGAGGSCEPSASGKVGRARRQRR